MKKEIFHPNREPENPLVVMYAIRERLVYTDWFDMFIKYTGTIEGISHVESSKSWDLFMISAGTKYFLIEVKVRGEWSMNSFGSQGAFIEELKYKNLFKYIEDRKDKDMKIEVIYLNFYKDGAVWWNLSEIPKPEFHYRDSKSNAQNDGKRTIKSMATLHLDEATVWKYPINIIDYNKQTAKWYKTFYPGFEPPTNFQLRYEK